jgi:hypothetical protein
VFAPAPSSDVEIVLPAIPTRDSRLYFIAEGPDGEL